MKFRFWSCVWEKRPGAKSWAVSAFQAKRAPRKVQRSCFTVAVKEARADSGDSTRVLLALPLSTILPTCILEPDIYSQIADIAGFDILYAYLNIPIGKAMGKKSARKKKNGKGKAKAKAKATQDVGQETQMERNDSKAEEEEEDSLYEKVNQFILEESRRRYETWRPPSEGTTPGTSDAALKQIITDVIKELYPDEPQSGIQELARFYSKELKKQDETASDGDKFKQDYLAALAKAHSREQEA